jgi:hypothetical protein
MRYDTDSKPYAATSLAKGLMCVWCSSVWIGIGFTALFSLSPVVAFTAALPFALSAVAVCLETKML